MSIGRIQSSVNFGANQKEKNVNPTWSRSRCNIGFFTLSAALIDCFASSKLTDLAIKKTNTKMHRLGVDGIVGISVLAVGFLAGLLFNAYDKQNPTKLGNFAYKLFNKSGIEK